MEPAKRFLEYASSFEQTFTDDNWARLEPYFGEDAIYTVAGGPPLGGRWEGKGQVLEHLRDSVNELDRRFDERQVESVGEPTIGDASFEMGWRATYKKAGCPDLVFEGTERATFDGDLILLLEDMVEDGADRRIQEYMARYFG
jgi:hypothetical protein